MKISRVLVSWDFAFAVTLSGLTLLLCPSVVSSSMAKDFYSVGISVLSIVFAVFFAAFAIIMSAGDNEFVAFLHQDGEYAEIIWSFRATVLILFASLLLALGEYTYVGFRIAQKAEWHSKWFLVAFAGGFSYALMAVALSVFDAIKYSAARVQYLSARKKLPAAPKTRSGSPYSSLQSPFALRRRPRPIKGRRSHIER